MKGKIIIVGGNQNALALALFTARDGFDICLYESKQENEVAYFWTDDINPSVFEKVGLPLPPDNVYYRTRSLTFVSPDKKNNIHLPLPDEQLDFSIKRRPFNEWLKTLAQNSGAKIVYGKKVDSLKIECGKVVGVCFGDNVEYADLVVDCTGAKSNLRDSLPNEFNIPKGIDDDDMFFVKRGYYRRPQNVPFPEHPKRLYLKHLEEPGISWCVLTKDEHIADVLVGRLGGMNDETFNHAFNDLKNDNPVIGELIQSSAQNEHIPVRHTISRLVAPGFALLGDSAFMTIPLIGSGIVSGITAAKMLAETLNIDNAFSVDNLYRYQVRFFKEIGIGFSAIDMAKIKLLHSKYVNAILDSGIMASVVLAVEGESGKLVSGVLKLSVSHPVLFWKIVRFALKMLKQVLITISMPKHYDDKKLLAWQKRYERVYIKMKQNIK